jgi:hydrogenase-4 membrane subunit HyfE
MKMIHALRGCSGITSALVSGLNTVPFIIEQSVMVDHVFINIVDNILRMNCSPVSS